MLLFESLEGTVHNHELCSVCRWMVVPREVARGRNLVRLVRRRTGRRVVNVSWQRYRCTTSCDRATRRVYTTAASFEPMHTSIRIRSTMTLVELKMRYWSQPQRTRTISQGTSLVLVLGRSAHSQKYKIQSALIVVKFITNHRQFLKECVFSEVKFC